MADMTDDQRRLVRAAGQMLDVGDDLRREATTAMRACLGCILERNEPCPARAAMSRLLAILKEKPPTYAIDWERSGIPLQPKDVKDTYWEKQVEPEFWKESGPDEPLEVRFGTQPTVDIPFPHGGLPAKEDE